MISLSEIQHVQDGMIIAIKTLSELVSGISGTLSGDKQKDYNQFKDVLNNEVNKIEKLELTTAVVAPMKSGKSTIINAIAGQELLPTRNAAMTTLPTEVVLKPEAKFARLLLSQKIVSACEGIIHKIIDKIEKQPNERFKILEPAPHLEKTLYYIVSDAKSSKIPTEVSGSKNIVETLILLNEIIRISTYLGISIESINRLDELPRIETPYIKEIAANKALGNLIIIDTPGPNEAGQEHLGLIVQNQLRKCSVIMFVLDYTNLNNVAAEDMKKEVEKIIALRGKENLFVLVNRIDARNGEKDMSVSEVLEYVKNLFKFDDSQYKERIFEISAKRAFVASNCLFEISKNEPEESAKEDLLKITDPFRWKSTIKTISDEDLSRSISDVWDSSNFSLFLEKAITKLLTDAAPIAIHSAINQCFGVIAKIVDDTALRKSGLEKEVEEIHNELEALSIDLAKVLKRREELNIAKSLKDKLEAGVLLIRKNINARFPESATKQFGGERSKTFYSSTDASLFVKNVRDATSTELTAIIGNYKEDVKNTLNDGQKSVVGQLSANIQPIINQVKLRVEKTFNVKITFKEPNVKDLLFDEENLNVISPNRKSHSWTEQKAIYRTVYKETIGLRRWLNSNLDTNFTVDTEEVFDRFENVQRESVSYDVYLSDFEKNFFDSIQANIKITEDFALAFIKDYIGNQVDLFFKDIDDYLESYKKTLHQMERDNKLSGLQKQELTQQLSDIQKSALIERERLQKIEVELKNIFLHQS